MVQLAERGRPAPIISSLVTQCVSLLDSLLDTMSQDPERSSTVHSHLARLKLWSGSLGAHRASGSRSLEYRLRDASSIRNHILSLLRDLKTAIVQAVTPGEVHGSGGNYDKADEELERYLLGDAAEQPSEADASLDQIGNLIDCLLRLSVTISNPAPYDQFKSRANLGVIDHFEPWDIQHVREKFPQCDAVIIRRLGAALARRRHYFRYREDHHNRLVEGLEADDLAEGEEVTTVASSIPQELKDAQADQPVVEAFDTLSHASSTSYAPSAKNDNEPRVPRVPREYIDGPFLCPFCRTLIEVDSRATWKKHVYKDLRPYVCVEKSCPMPDIDYLRRNDWSNHMRQEHWKAWSCPYNCPKTFTKSTEFQEHVVLEHHHVSPSKISTLKILIAQADLTKAIGQCPLCSDFQIKSCKQYDSHVGDHLEKLALFSLPSIEDDDFEQEDLSQFEKDLGDDYEQAFALRKSVDEERSAEAPAEEDDKGTEGLGLAKIESINPSDWTSNQSVIDKELTDNNGNSDFSVLIGTPHDARIDVFENSGPEHGSDRSLLSEEYYGQGYDGQQPEYFQNSSQVVLPFADQRRVPLGVPGYNPELKANLDGRLLSPSMQQYLSSPPLPLPTSIGPSRTFGPEQVRDDPYIRARERAKEDIQGDKNTRAEESVHALGKAKEEIEEAGNEANEDAREAIKSERRAEVARIVTEMVKEGAEAEAARIAAIEAHIELEAAIKAKEEAEAEAAEKTTEEQEWRKNMEEEAKLKAEIETRLKLQADKEVVEKANLVEETKKKEEEAFKKKALEEAQKIRFKDAIGRRFSFPFYLCRTWQGMEELIKQAFLHVDHIGLHIQAGHYDLLGPNGEIILPQVWEKVIEPDMAITMQMWPMEQRGPPGGILDRPPTLDSMPGPLHKEQRKQRAAEDARLAQIQAQIKLEAAIKAKEETEAEGAKKTTEEQEWVKNLEEEAKLKSEIETRVELKAEKEMAE